MRAQRQSSQVFSYLEKARQYYPQLGIKEKDDEAFLQSIGCGKDIKKGWYQRGIKPIYHKVLSYIEETQRLREESSGKDKRIQELEEKLKSKSPN